MARLDFAVKIADVMIILAKKRFISALSGGGVLQLLKIFWKMTSLSS